MRVNFQSAALRFVAIALAALMVVLIWAGIQSIATHQQTQKPNPPTLASNSAPAQVIRVPRGRGNGQTSPAATASTRSPQPSPSASATPKPANTTARTAAAKPKESSRPTPERRASPTPTAPPLSPIPASRQPANPAIIAATDSLALRSGNLPKMESAIADSTNYGDRYATDINGKPVSNELLVVLHETTQTASSAINTVQTPHEDEMDQVSYHAIIRQDGSIVFLVPPEKRAFGAGNSVFDGSNGPETVKTHRRFPPSVNNFAYHISLETPPDGYNSKQTHSGYSTNQYASLAWLIAWTGVPEERITTHRAVDRSGSRIDPRSFDMDLLKATLRQY